MFVFRSIVPCSKQREKNLSTPLNVSRNIGPTNKTQVIELQSEQF